MPHHPQERGPARARELSGDPANVHPHEQASSLALANDPAHQSRAGLLHFPHLPPLTLYVHFPWCLRKCPYCDFNSHALSAGVQPPQQQYVQALIDDLEAALPLIWGRQVHSIYLGGGTPSLFAPQTLESLLSALRSRVPLTPDCEITLEANPGTFERARFDAYRQAGINRLSLGVQSFNDAHLSAIGRVHDRAQALAAAQGVASAFERFNFDLMYALPGQSLSDLKSDLQIALDLGAPHLSIYQLTIEPGTAFAKAPPPLPSEDQAWDMLDLIGEECQKAALDRYEVSAFARNSMCCAHNLNYWQFGDYLGLGAGAHSKLTFAHRIVRQERWSHPQRFMTLSGSGQALSSSRDVPFAQIPFEFMLNALRLREGFDPRLFYERTALPPSSIAAKLEQAQSAGLLECGPERIGPTARGFDFLNDLLSIFLD